MLGIASTTTAEDGQKYKGLVFDATGIKDASELHALRDFFTPKLRSLASCPRVVVIGTPPEQVKGSERVAQRALEGFTRSLGKEIGKGGTVQLVYVAEGAEGAATSTLAFLLSPKSAYVSGQVIRIGAHGTKDAADVADWTLPLAGRVALVTGASRGIGEQIARVLHRDGATVVGVDVPQLADDLQTLMKELGGDWLALDITQKDAPQRIAHHLKEKHGGVDVVVHNAGITRDKKLANMAEDKWDSVIAVNLTAPERITRELLDQKVINANGSVVGVASIAGIAGNVGQTNYAASKAGVIGLVDSLADEVEDGITINAVAPGLHHHPDDRRRAVRDPRGRPAAQRDVAGRAAGRRRRDDRLVRLPRLVRGQRQRRPRLRPDDAGRLMNAALTLARAALPSIPVVNQLPGIRKTGGELTGLSRTGTSTVDRAGPRRRVRARLRLPDQGHGAAALPAPARLPDADVDHERPGLPGAGHRHRAPRELHHRAPLDRDRRDRDGHRQRRPGPAAPQGHDLRLPHPGPRRRRDRVGGDLVVPPPRQGRRQRLLRQRLPRRRPRTAWSGSCPATSAGGTPRCRATTTRSTSTR